MTAIEKALRVLVNTIKELDKNTLNLDVLNSRKKIRASRKILFNVIEKSGYELTINCKLIEKQTT